MKATSNVVSDILEMFWGRFTLQEEAEVQPCRTPELGWRTDFSEVYLLGELIGKGAFGQVHLGLDRHGSREYAVKTMQKVRGRCSRESTLEKIRREASMMRRAQTCPGVVQLVDCFEDEDYVHLVTEVCRGGDLKKYVEGHGALEEATLAMVAFEALKIVQGCHALGILYSDVKPANFCMLDIMDVKNTTSQPSIACRLKAVDFGCSQLLGSGRLSKRSGTLAFMAPEIFAQDFAHKADVWSTGVMLYWLFTQRLPYWDNSQVPKMTRIEDMAHVVQHAPISYDYGPWVDMSPEGLDFIAMCLTRPEGMRMGVEDALQHPWLAKFVDEERRLSLDGCSYDAGL